MEIPANGIAKDGVAQVIKSIVNFCLRERLVVLLVTMATIAYGWYSFREVPIDAIPNVSENQVIVLTEWPGRSPKDIEDQITYPLVGCSCSRLREPSRFAARACLASVLSR